MERLAHIGLLALALVATALVLAVAAPEASARPSAVPGASEPAALAARRGAFKRRSASLGEKAARFARRWIGTPYRWGGASPAGFDCSGLVSYAYGRFGVRLPHNAAQLFGVGRPVDTRRLRPGDLLFFRGLGHVGMYVGAGRMIHAPQSGEHVEVISLASRADGLVGARRVVGS